jgi:hypothetical protein
MSTEKQQHGRFSGRYWLRLIIFTAVVSLVAAIFLLAYFMWLQLEAFVTWDGRSIRSR